MIFAVIANGVQAGGVALTPHAKLNDGKLEVFWACRHSPWIRYRPSSATLPIWQGSAPRSILRCEQISWMNFRSDIEIPISPDGEEHPWPPRPAKIAVLPRALPFIMPDGPLLV